MSERASAPADRSRLVAGILLAFLGVAVACWWLGTSSVPVDAAPQQQPPPVVKPPVAIEGVEQLRPRLAYEAKSDRKTSKMTVDAQNELVSLERGLREERRGAVRRKVDHLLKTNGELAKLHEKSIADFVNAEGFGIERMVVMVPKSFEKQEAPPILVTRAGDTDPPGAAVKLVPSAPDNMNPLRLPGLAFLNHYHREGQQSFVNLAGYAFVPGVAKKDHPLTEAFRPHQFRHTPELRAVMQKPDPKSAERWDLGRLELVSLLRHEQPAVYVSDALPRMEDLRKAKTRALTEFEGEALAKLQKGEHLIADATVNRIHMVGALRAATQCLSCHQVDRGTLLGAFSYELRRTPPLREQAN